MNTNGARQDGFLDISQVSKYSSLSGALGGPFGAGAPAVDHLQDAYGHVHPSDYTQDHSNTAFGPTLFPSTSDQWPGFPADDPVVDASLTILEGSESSGTMPNAHEEGLREADGDEPWLTDFKMYCHLACYDPKEAIETIYTLGRYKYPSEEQIEALSKLLCISAPKVKWR